jgi:CRP-like cAMP-binding protein
MPTDTTPMAGPIIRAVHPWTPGNAERHTRHQLLSDDERARLAKVAQIVRFKKGEQIYEEGDVSNAAFNIMSGVVVAYRALGKGEHVTAFLYPGDLFGLSEEGQYINATRAATPVVAYRIPLPAVRRILDNHADLDVNVIIKLCEETREAQRHAFLLAHKRATTRLAMFLDLQEHLQSLSHETASEIFLPMARSSIAAYLGLTLAAVSRAFRSLISKNIISFRDRHHVIITDRDAFSRIADTHPAGS